MNARPPRNEATARARASAVAKVQRPAPPWRGTVETVGVAIHNAIRENA